MPEINPDRIRCLTPEDLRTFYPHALRMALDVILRSFESDSTAAPYMQAMRAQLAGMSHHAVDPEGTFEETVVMSMSILRRMGLDGDKPLFEIDLSEWSEKASFDDQELQLAVLYKGDLRALALALWMTLDALVQGEGRYAVDRSEYEGEARAMLNEAVSLMPRMSINMAEAAPLH
ncbi:MAG: hypothetical protein F4Y31_05290 [Gammaproteobacteria bacterium]|nr:hypothetical protein [Gammaproteobacteria bacterium]MYF66213.1 hypothetical protein [Gammaproteobacteria bacterium]MYK38220.1 hypothetical protein [Gammaproteobacteria bacterium]